MNCLTVFWIWMFTCMFSTVILQGNLKESDSIEVKQGGPAELALWFIIVLISLPIILAIFVTLVCCNYICFWGRGHNYGRGPALLVDRGCSRNSNNFNAF